MSEHLCHRFALGGSITGKNQGLSMFRPIRVLTQTAENIPKILRLS